MRRSIFAVIVAVTVFATVFGLAASLDVNTTELAGGQNVVSGCDTSVDVSFGLLSTDLSEVAEVTIGDIALACDTQDIHVQLLDSSGNVLAQVSDVVSITNDPDSMTLTLTSTVLASSIADTTVTISG